jgi:hypothetical protein
LKGTRGSRPARSPRVCLDPAGIEAGLGVDRKQGLRRAASVDLRSVPEMTAPLQWAVMTYWPIVLISAAGGMVVLLAMLALLRRD